MFIWVTLPAEIDTSKLVEAALAADVAFVPGAAFFGDRPQINCMRLSFATGAEEQIREGVRRLGAVVKAALIEGGVQAHV